MTQLLEQSTATNLGSRSRTTSPSNTALWDWVQDYSRPVLPLGSFQKPNDNLSVTASPDHDIPDRSSSNLTDRWEPLHSFEAYFHLSFHGPWQNWAIENDFPLRSLPQTAPVAAIDFASPGPDEDHLQSDRATGIEDSALLIEERLVNYFSKLIRDSIDDVFTDGMESPLSRQLIPIVETFGDTAIQAIVRLMGSNGENVEVTGELLRQLGTIEDQNTHHNRLTILINGLQANDPRIRDAASLGIAALDDTSAIGAIQKAFDREPSPHIKRNLKLVLDQLQAMLWQGS